MGKRSTKKAKGGRRPAKRKRGARGPHAPSSSKAAARGSRWGSSLLILAFVTLPALVVAPGAKESFRLPKLFAFELLALLSLLLVLVLSRVLRRRRFDG